MAESSISEHIMILRDRWFFVEVKMSGAEERKRLEDVNVILSIGSSRNLLVSPFKTPGRNCNASCSGRILVSGRCGSSTAEYMANSSIMNRLLRFYINEMISWERPGAVFSMQGTLFSEGGCIHSEVRFSIIHA